MNAPVFISNNRITPVTAVSDRHRLLASLRTARTAHQRWVGQALARLEGMAAAGRSLILDPRGCDFAVWYYGQGAELAGFPDFKEIEPLHVRLHEVAGEIAPLIRNEPGSVLSRLFGKGGAGTPQKELLAKQISRLSRRIVGLLDQIEGILEGMSEAEVIQLTELPIPQP